MKILAIAATLIVAAASPVCAKDILIAEMDNGRGGKEVHMQTAKSDGCVQLLWRLKELRKEGQKMQLTFTDPPFSGYVLDLHCIRPNGSIVGSEKSKGEEHVD
jgi:hypothetical protein